jgi:hypothetical protein
MEPSAQKENMLFQLGAQVAASFNTPYCDGKITMSSKASLSRYYLLRAAPLPGQFATSLNRDGRHSDQSATV